MSMKRRTFWKAALRIASASANIAGTIEGGLEPVLLTCSAPSVEDAEDNQGSNRRDGSYQKNGWHSNHHVSPN